MQVKAASSGGLVSKESDDGNSDEKSVTPYPDSISVPLQTNNFIGKG